MFHNTTATAADAPLDAAAYTRRVLQFPCSEVMCQAWLYLPKNTQEKPPVVLAAHGVGEWLSSKEEVSRYLLQFWIIAMMHAAIVMVASS